MLLRGHLQNRSIDHGFSTREPSLKKAVRTADQRNSHSESLEALRTRLNAKILGKNEVIELALTSLLARGNLLLEDVPGSERQRLRGIWRRPTGSFQQFSSRRPFANGCDRCAGLPAELEDFEFKKDQSSPISFSLMKSIVPHRKHNRVCCKRWEYQITVDRQTIPLPKPFMVIATQNPMSFEGTYPLPESQLDRFMMTIRMGYPDRAAERALLRNGAVASSTIDQPVMSLETLLALQSHVHEIHCADDLLTYVQDIVDPPAKVQSFPRGEPSRCADAPPCSTSTGDVEQSRLCCS